MINFDTELDRGVTTVEVPRATVTVTTRPSERRTHVLSEPSSWSPEQLRDYVVAQIQKHHGPFPRDAVRETSIFRGFVNRWGGDAGRIARVAFEEFGGMWRNAPVGINRFCKNSDPYFAEPILERLK